MQGGRWASGDAAGRGFPALPSLRSYGGSGKPRFSTGGSVHLGFLFEALLRTGRGRSVRVEDFQRGVGVWQRTMHKPINSPHPTLAELSLDDIITEITANNGIIKHRRGRLPTRAARAAST